MKMMIKTQFNSHRKLNRSKNLSIRNKNRERFQKRTKHCKTMIKFQISIKFKLLKNRKKKFSKKM